MTEPVRLAKRIAELRGCSRREAELLITGGWVQVAGVMVEEPHFRVSDQSIAIDPAADPDQAQDVTLLLHQPAGTPIPLPPDTASHWADDPDPRRILKKHVVQLTPCAPLDAAASGLVVYTQDWRIVRKLTADTATLEHELLVDVAAQLPPDGLKRMARALPHAKISWQSEQPPARRHERRTLPTNCPPVRNRRLAGADYEAHPPRRRGHGQTAAGAMAVSAGRGAVLRGCCQPLRPVAILANEVYHALQTCRWITRRLNNRV